MNNKVIIVVLVVAALCVAGYIYYNSGAVITVEGDSVVKAQPDEISVQVLIQTRNLTLQDAQNQNNQIYTNTVDGLRGLGINDSQISLDNYNSYPDYNWDGTKQVSNGYVVSRQITVKADKFDSVSGIVDSVINSGSTVNYINFELSQKKQNELKAEALKEAGQDAGLKAQSVAEGVGKNVGRLVSIQLQEFRYGPYPVYANAGTGVMQDNAQAKSAAENIAPNSIEVPATVTATYKLSAF